MFIKFCSIFLGVKQDFINTSCLQKINVCFIIESNRQDKTRFKPLDPLISILNNKKIASKIKKSLQNKFFSDVLKYLVFKKEWRCKNVSEHFYLYTTLEPGFTWKLCFPFWWLTWVKSSTKNFKTILTTFPWFYRVPQ